MRRETPNPMRESGIRADTFGTRSSEKQLWLETRPDGRTRCAGKEMLFRGARRASDFGGALRLRGFARGTLHEHRAGDDSSFDSGERPDGFRLCCRRIPDLLP